jgi:hypothetical protein
MSYQYIYQCSESAACPNPKCRHKTNHFAQRQSILKGNYVTCATNFAFCSRVQKYVKCELSKNPIRTGSSGQGVVSRNQAIELQPELI